MDSSRLTAIVAFLNREHRRATYGAVGEVLGIQPQSVGLFLGERRPEVSWVVAKRNGKPSRYSQNQEHPALYERPEVITSGPELIRRMKKG